MKVCELIESHLTKDEAVARLKSAVKYDVLNQRKEDIPSAEYVIEYCFGLHRGDEAKAIFNLAKESGVNFNTQDVVKKVLTIYRHIDEDYTEELFKRDFYALCGVIGINNLPTEFRAISKSLHEARLDEKQDKKAFAIGLATGWLKKNYKSFDLPLKTMRIPTSGQYIFATTVVAGDKKKRMYLHVIDNEVKPTNVAKWNEVVELINASKQKKAEASADTGVTESAEPDYVISFSHVTELTDLFWILEGQTVTLHFVEYGAEGLHRFDHQHGAHHSTSMLIKEPSATGVMYGRIGGAWSLQLEKPMTVYSLDPTLSKHARPEHAKFPYLYFHVDDLEKSIDVHHLDKNKFMKRFLEFYKSDVGQQHGDSGRNTPPVLKAFKHAGMDFPEFAAIEKSLPKHEPYRYDGELDEEQKHGNVIKHVIDIEHAQETHYLTELLRILDGQTITVTLHPASEAFGKTRLHHLYALDKSFSGNEADENFLTPSRAITGKLFLKRQSLAQLELTTPITIYRYNYTKRVESGKTSKVMFHPDNVIQTIEIRNLDKDMLLKNLLTMYKEWHTSEAGMRKIKSVVKELRMSGMDFPELDSISKSAES